MLYGAEAPPETLDHVDVLEGIEAAHAAMVVAIEGACESVVLGTYIFRRDPFSALLVDALLRAVDWGVTVRILIDQFANSAMWGYRRWSSYNWLRGHGLNVRRFQGGTWPSFRNCYHRKICVIDAKIAFVGSQNIGWVHNLETHFRFSESIAVEIKGVFDRDWACAKSDAPSNSALKLSSPSENIYRAQVDKLIAQSRTRIRILTPYCLPDAALISKMVDALSRGIEIELLLPKKSNYTVLDWASRQVLASVERAGARIYLRNRVFDHSKIMTVDGKIAFIGTSNWDMRSFKNNFEIDLLMEDNSLCSRLDRLFEERYSDAISKPICKVRPRYFKSRRLPLEQSLQQNLAKWLVRIM